MSHRILKRESYVVFAQGTRSGEFVLSSDAEKQPLDLSDTIRKLQEQFFVENLSAWHTSVLPSGTPTELILSVRYVPCSQLL